MHRSLIVSCVLCLLSTRVPAQDVLPGADLLQTPIGSFEDFATTPIPAGFFGPGSDPFTGVIHLIGEPLLAVQGEADTIVERLDIAILPTCPSSAVIPIEILALSLVSVQPITVTFGGGATSSEYDVRVWRSLQGQPQGQMQIRKEHALGGTFTSFLPVRPAFYFTRCATSTAGNNVVQLDPGPLLNLSVPGPGGGPPGTWVYSDPGFGIVPSNGGLTDDDCDPFSPPLLFPGSSNFIPGIGFSPPPTCDAPGGSPFKELTREQEMLAEHGVLPNCPAPGIPFCSGDGSATPCPCGNDSPAGSEAGCRHSFTGGFDPGPTLRASGTNSVAEDSACINGLVLKVRGLPPSTAILFFQGTATVNGGLGVVFGDGLRCVGGTVRRLGTKTTACGPWVTTALTSRASAYYGCPPPLLDTPVAVKGALPPTGGLRHYQAWYRNAAPFCTSSTFNLTNGYSIAWTP